MNWWDKISSIGLRHTVEEDDVRRIQLLNRVIFIALIFNAAFVFVCHFTGKELFVVPQALTTLGIASLYKLNQRGRFEITAYLLIGLFMLNVTVGSLLSVDVGTKLILIPLAVSVLAIFKRTASAVFMLVAIIINYCIIEYLNDLIIPIVFPDTTVAVINYVFDIVIVFIVSFLVVYHFRSTNTAYQKKLIDQKDIIETKNNEIVDSIQYAYRIQRAILPPLSNFEEWLPENFVFYQPKDIVAGDFFWIEETNDGVLFAVADCTGHGVPGAMVSVICHHALNRAVREFGLHQPALILTKARELVVETFEESEEEINDGMDIALCMLDKQNNTLHFSGANNGLYVVKNSHLTTVKADRQPVARYAFAADFQQHKIELEEGDSIYIYSDGFADQFGGPKGKKYKYKPFKELLLSISSKPMQEQKQLIADAFKSWKGNHEQVDDVCIIGLKL